MEIQKSHFVTDWLEKRACHTPDRAALQDAASGLEVSYREWNIRVNQTANWLRAQGIGMGDRVSTYAGNCLEYLDILMACGKLGAIQHNMNWRLTVAELEGILRDAETSLLIYGAEYVEQVDQLRERVPSVPRFVGLKDQSAPGDGHFSEREGFATTLDDKPDLGMDTPWAIYYTGGTTGLPKGAIITHGNIVWNSLNTITTWDIRSDDVGILQLPMFHIGGPNIFMFPMIHMGGKQIVCRAFDVDQTYDLIATGGATHFVGVPTMFILMQQHPRWEETDFSHMRLIISGGAPCPLPVMEKFWAKGVPFKMGYGLTEAAGNNFWLPPELIQHKIGSVGYPCFHVDMKVVRPDGTRCDPDEPGELLIRGPHVTPGYWQRPESTAESIPDGWLHTGDLARTDSDGCFYIIGRSKDMLISGGENVYPAEIESVMHAHPAVAEAALIGVPDEKWGEVGRAVVVLEAGRNLNEAELLGFLAGRLAKYKIPKSVIFAESLPKTVIGKLDKLELARLYGEGREG
jgi:fatty-acyl-CoA synthase